MQTSFPFLIALLSLSNMCSAQTKIIDMHIHSYDSSQFNTPSIDYYGNKGASNTNEHFAQTYKAFKKFNIVKALISGSPNSVETWFKADTSHIVIRGIGMNHPTDFDMDTIKFEQMIKDKKIEIFAEAGAYYSGTTLSDSVWQPYLRICEKHDIPVGVHTGGGDPGGTYSWSPKARLKLGDPYLIEDVLVAYPKLRIYMMHSGEDWYEHALRLMAYYPQLYSDLGAMLWVEPLDQRYATEFLKVAKQSGYLNRVMFGTDQMKWPYAIEKAIRFLNSLTFLTKGDKEDIFYNNAARFLRLQK